MESPGHFDQCSFLKPQVKGDILRNIEKMNESGNWKAVRLSDAITQQERNQQRDLQC